MAPRKKLETFEKIIESVLDNQNYDAGDVRITDFEGSNEPAQSASNNAVSADIVKLSYANIPLYIDNAYYTRQSLLIYGDPGLGKSEIVQQTAKKIAAKQGRAYVIWHKLPDGNKDETETSNVVTKRAVIANPSKYFVMIDVRVAQMEPADLLGIPNIRNREKYLEMNPQKYIYLMSLQGSAGILFLDELNQGSPQILKALFQVVLDRSSGNYSFTDDWGLVAAGNIGSQFGNEMLPIALTNRFLAGQLVADPEAWIQYAKENGVDDNIIAFVESQPDKNFYVPPQEATSNPFPSPRQFIALSKQIKYIIKQYVDAHRKGEPIVQNIYKTINDVAAQLCGVAWANKFMTFVRHQKTYNWDRISKDPTIISDNGSQKLDVDKQYAIVLVARDAFLRALNDKSSMSSDEQLEFVRLFCKVLSHFTTEYQLILINRINKADIIANAKFISIINTNKDKYPELKKAADICKNLISFSKGV